MGGDAHDSEDLISIQLECYLKKIEGPGFRGQSKKTKRNGQVGQSAFSKANVTYTSAGTQVVRLSDKQNCGFFQKPNTRSSSQQLLLKKTEKNIPFQESSPTEE